MTAYSIPPLLTLCCFFGLAVLSLWRGPRTKINILFFMICVLGCFLYIDILVAFNIASGHTALWVSRVDHGLIVYLFPLYIHFFHAYLNIRGRRWLVACGYGLAFLLMCATPTPLYIRTMARYPFGWYATGGVLYPLFALAGLAATVYVLVLLVQAMAQERDSTRKTGLTYVLAGFGVMGLLNSLSVLPSVGIAIYPPGNFSFVPLTVFYVGLFRHDLMDMGLLVRKGLVYSLFTAVMTGLYALIVTAAGSAFGAAADSIYFTAFFFLIVVIVFGPLKTLVQKFIDRLFYKGKYDYRRTIKQASRIIAADRNLDLIAGRLVETLVDAMQVDNCSLYVATAEPAGFGAVAAGGRCRLSEKPHITGSGSMLIRAMAGSPRPVVKGRLPHGSNTALITAEMNAVDAAVVLPLTFNHRLTGFIALGEKRCGDPVCREDLDLLETLANQTALAVENARSYRQVLDLNENLEATVEARTRALAKTLAEMEKTQERLIRSESLAAIGQLVAGTAHELNNPLASAASLLQSVLEDLADADQNPPPVETLVDDLEFAGKELARAGAIVSSLLDLSRQTQTYAETVDFNAVVTDALRVLDNRARHGGVKVATTLEDNLPAVRGNFANLGQVVINIVQNAMDAVTPDNGQITLSTTHDPSLNQIVFACRDNGRGVPPAIRGDIFKPFFTTKPVGKGTGLGLYICHEIVQKHNGSLNLEPGDRMGTVFTVRLPATR